MEEVEPQVVRRFRLRPLERWRLLALDELVDGALLQLLGVLYLFVHHLLVLLLDLLRDLLRLEVDVAQVLGQLVFVLIFCGFLGRSISLWQLVWAAERAGGRLRHQDAGTVRACHGPLFLKLFLNLFLIGL